jgi:hypothetical protein
MRPSACWRRIARGGIGDQLKRCGGPGGAGTELVDGGVAGAREEGRAQIARRLAGLDPAVEANDDLGDGIFGVGASDLAAEAAQQVGLAKGAQLLQLADCLFAAAAGEELGELAGGLHQTRGAGGRVLQVQGRSPVIGAKTRVGGESIPRQIAKSLSSTAHR